MICTFVSMLGLFSPRPAPRYSLNSPREIVQVPLDAFSQTIFRVNWRSFGAHACRLRLVLSKHPCDGKFLFTPTLRSTLQAFPSPDAFPRALPRTGRTRLRLAI